MTCFIISQCLHYLEKTDILTCTRKPGKLWLPWQSYFIQEFFFLTLKGFMREHCLINRPGVALEALQTALSFRHKHSILLFLHWFILFFSNISSIPLTSTLFFVFSLPFYQFYTVTWFTPLSVSPIHHLYPSNCSKSLPVNLIIIGKFMLATPT